MFCFLQDWAEWGVTQLQLATVDFNNAPSQEMLRRGVEFIEKMNLCENSVYVHCKAGRGRSTTLVACYLMKVKESNKNQVLFILGRRSDLMVSALNSGLNSLGSSPGRGTALCSWARHFTLSASLRPGV